jgi:hypothetical protein
MGRTLAALGALLLATAPLAAQDLATKDSPWCVRLDTFTRNCAFATYNDCMAIAATATGPATGASSCIRNPDYKAPPAPIKSTKTKIKKDTATLQH